MRQPHEPTSGRDQKAIRDSLKFEARLVAHSEIEIMMKKRKAEPTKGKYQNISSLHSSPFTIYQPSMHVRQLLGVPLHVTQGEMQSVQVFYAVSTIFSGHSERHWDSWKYLSTEVW